MSAQTPSSKERLRSMFRVQTSLPATEDIETTTAPDAAAPTSPQKQPRQPVSRRSTDARRETPSRRGKVTEPQSQVEELPARSVSRHIRRAFTVEEGLLEDVTDAVVVLSGWPHQLTLAQFVDDAFRAQLERWRTKYNEGRPFPKTGARLRPGRRPGT